MHKITPRRSSIKSPRRKPNVQLPDVTGLTNAVESPDKPLQRHYAYRSDDPLLETESKLLHSPNVWHWFMWTNSATVLYAQCYSIETLASGVRKCHFTSSCTRTGTRIKSMQSGGKKRAHTSVSGRRHRTAAAAGRHKCSQKKQIDGSRGGSVKDREIQRSRRGEDRYGDYNNGSPTTDYDS